MLWTIYGVESLMIAIISLMETKYNCNLGYKRDSIWLQFKVLRVGELYCLWYIISAFFTFFPILWLIHAWLTCHDVINKFESLFMFCKNFGSILPPGGARERFLVKFSTGHFSDKELSFHIEITMMTSFMSLK